MSQLRGHSYTNSQSHVKPTQPAPTRTHRPHQIPADLPRPTVPTQNQPKRSTTRLTLPKLDDDVLLHIVSHLDVSDIQSLRLVSTCPSAFVYLHLVSRSSHSAHGDTSPPRERCLRVRERMCEVLMANCSEELVYLMHKAIRSFRGTKQGEWRAKASDLRPAW